MLARRGFRLVTAAQDTALLQTAVAAAATRNCARDYRSFLEGELTWDRSQLKWTGDDSHLFVGRDSRGSTVVAGMWPRAEEEGWVDWRGAKASDLLVVSLCACSAYDVVDILKKQRLGLTGLTVTADPTQAPEPPWAFTHIHLHYVATGRDLDPVKVERAIKLSQDKYCSVAATIRGVTEITFDFEVRSEA